VDRLNSLPTWDSEDHIGALFADYLGVELNAYTRAVTRKFVVGLIDRILNPGCKFDYMLVLVGDQGRGKSSFWNSWFPEYYTEDFSFRELRDKAGSEKLQCCCIVEAAELEGLGQANIELVKRFLTQRSDLYRKPYALKATQHKRKCVFVGTTNNLEGFLMDASGNRRFWPVPINSTRATKKMDEVAESIDLALAQGLALYRQGEKSYLSEEEEELAREVQNSYLYQDDATSLILSYTDILWPEDRATMTSEERRCYVQEHIAGNYEGLDRELYPQTEICNLAIMNELLVPFYGPNHKYKAADIARAMKQLQGWERSKRRKVLPHYGQQYYYAKRADA